MTDGRDTKTRHWLSGLAEALLEAFSDAPADPFVRTRPELGIASSGRQS
jgi:hypothetical protein